MPAPVALVTGAGRGLGRAIALALAASGWDTGLLARTTGELNSVAAEVAGIGRRAWVLPASVADPTAVAGAFAGLDRQAGALNVLVNCAGLGGFSPVEHADPEKWSRVIDVNLKGLFHCCREAVPRLRAAGGGDIINVLSVAARVAFPGASAYCASKWGGLGFTKVLAEEVRRESIRVTAVLPGSIDTPFWDTVTHGLDRDDMLSAVEVAEAIASLLRQPRSLHTDEIMLMPPKGIL